MQAQLQGEFDKINERLDAHDARFQQIDVRFDRFEARFERIEDDMRDGFDRVNTTLDGVANRIEDNYVERLALSAQVTRHEDWIVAAVPVVKVQYVPDA
ncbi:hypothetical protein [uncultured Microbacterium sp.]|uniref:hypothetical protein n=1 Tax=uncultured Microbacterium sp. TaxID=191216 RepID=UPI0035CA1314